MITVSYTTYYIAYQDGPADNDEYGSYEEAYEAMMKTHVKGMPLDRYVATRNEDIPIHCHTTILNSPKGKR